MEALGDLVARDRRSDDPALVVAREDRRYDYRRFCTTAWKTGNFWRRIGVHADSTIAVAADPDSRSDFDSDSADSVSDSDSIDSDPVSDSDPETVFSFLGAALLGARTRFGLPDSAPNRPADARPLDARVTVAHRDEIEQYEVPPGSKRVAYGGPPDDPGIAHFERDVWSENPAFPETAVGPDATALVVGDADADCSDADRSDTDRTDADRGFSHADLLTAARAVADDWRLRPGDEVAVRTSLARPGAVVAGVLAPLLAGAAILFPDGDAKGTAAVVADGADAPESRTVAASAVV